MADNLPEDRIVWRDPIGLTDFADPLDNQDTFVNVLYLQARYFRIRNLNVEGKLKYERFNQLDEQASLRRDRSFLGLINKARLRHPPQRPTRPLSQVEEHVRARNAYCADRFGSQRTDRELFLFWASMRSCRRRSWTSALNSASSRT